VTLPQAEAEDLSRLYDALTQPLPQPPSREDRLSRMAVEDASADGFWRRRSRSLEACAYRVRCLGVQGDLPGAHAAFDEMQAAGLRPDAAAYAALVDACAKGGDAAAARAVLAEMRRAGVAPNAPVWTGLMQAHVAAGDPPEAVTAVLREMEDGGAVVDVPANTAVVQAYVRHGRLQEAWHAFDEMRLKGRLPDAVTFALMMHACALADQLEQADGLWNDMLMSGVAPTLAAHNAYISACASRARSLARLPRRKREWLHKLSVDTDPRAPLERAHRHVARLADDGLAPDRHTYTALLRAHAGCGDARGAQRTLTRMLDAGVDAAPAHFHQLLVSCMRAQRLQPASLQTEHTALALSVPPSMEAAGLEVDAHALDLVIGVHAAGLRLHTTLRLLGSLHGEYALPHTGRAHAFALQLCDKIHRAGEPGAASVLRMMEEAGLPPSDEQRALPATIAARKFTPHVALPRLPALSYSARRGGFVRPEEAVSPATKAAWTLTRAGRALPPGRASGRQRSLLDGGDEEGRG